MSSPVVSNSKKITINAISSSLQVIAVSVFYLLLYRYLLVKLGSAQLGIWSLVLATASLVNMANFGITTSMVKFVSQYNAEERYDAINKLVFTAFISMLLFFITLIVALYFIASVILKKLVDPAHIAIALDILPFSLCSLFVNGLGGVFSSVLDGFQKNYQRNLIYVSSSLVLLVLSYIMVPAYGIKGVAYAQVIQSAYVLIASFIVSAKLYNAKVFFRWSWDKPIFKDIFSYGLKFQVISLSQLLYEPTTKALLSKFAGLSSVAYYEMGSRLVNQVRGLIVNANQVVVPVVANAAIKNQAAINKIYSVSMSIVLFITVPLMAGLIFFAPSVSYLWIGHIEPIFVFAVIIISIGMFFNIMGTPAYYGFMGEGQLNVILIMHIIIAIINLAAGYLLSKFFPLYGAILGWGIALIIGSSTILLNYQKTKKLPFKSFLVSKDYLLIAGGITVTIATLVVYFAFNNQANLHLIQYILLSLAGFCAVFVPLLLTNQNFKLTKDIVRNMFKK